MLEVDGDGRLITARRVRRQGCQKAYEMQMAIATRQSDAETLGRSALASLVVAFLMDRVGQADLFAVAHRVGREISSRFGCSATYDTSEQTYTFDCPILTLHSVIATSIGWIWETRCSICDAAMLECDHVPGEQYGDEVASYTTGGGGLLRFDHLALTPRPDFHYTWIVDNRRSAARLISEGQIQQPGDEATCDHCRWCWGSAGARPDDLDPVARWDRLNAAHE
jgi:hypothetical protein